jgi:hypothetical protein
MKTHFVTPFFKTNVISIHVSRIVKKTSEIPAL